MTCRMFTCSKIGLTRPKLREYEAEIDYKQWSYDAYKKLEISQLKIVF